MKENKGFAQIIYAIWCVVLVSLAVFFFLAWQNHHRFKHPNVVIAKPALHVDEFPVEGWLLWQEEAVSSPVKGVLKFVNGGKVARVAKGEAIAVIEGDERKVVWAPKAGYFVPALDGEEGNWNFARVWLDYDNLPKAVKARTVPQGVNVQKGTLIGKVIPLPQALRCVFYVYLTPKVKENLQKNFLWIRLDEMDVPFRVEVLAKEILGLKARVNIALTPYFPAHLTIDRKLNLMIYEGRRHGVLLPEESVIFKKGKQGVYVVSKGLATFKEIKGIPMEGNMYFVEEGLLPGEIVILNGDKAREGRVFLW
ncbi:MAG: HlyD family efflux transporter periplasmic adaptor subunit [Acetomicrobium sp.]